MSNLTGTDKSVILLMTIGEDRAAEVFKHLSQREVQTLSAAMANVTQISNKQLTDVLAEFEQEAEQFAALNINANDYLRSVLVKALGEERAASLLEDILETRDTASGIETLNFMEPQSAADLIRDEHPQIIATILVHLKRAQAADILALFDERLRHDVMLRIATFGGVQPAALAELTEVLNGLLDGQNLKRSKMGGVRTAAEIINLMKTQQEEAVITAVREFDGELAQKIIDEMFLFENLVDVDVADVEGYGAAAEVEVPHAGEFFAAGSDDFIADVLEVIEPAHEGLIVMAAQAFDVDDLEVIVVSEADDFTERRQGSAREDVFAHPRVADAFVVATDVMEEEHAAVLQEVAGCFHVQRIIGAADVFQHADADDAVVLTAFGDEVTVVDEVYLYQVLEAQFFNAFLAFFPLFFTERATIAFDAIFLGSFDEQVAPAAADIEEGHAFFEVEFFQDVMDFIMLCLFEAVVFILEVCAGIAWTGRAIWHRSHSPDRNGTKPVSSEPISIPTDRGCV